MKHLYENVFLKYLNLFDNLIVGVLQTSILRIAYKHIKNRCAFPYMYSHDKIILTN